MIINNENMDNCVLRNMQMLLVIFFKISMFPWSFNKVKVTKILFTLVERSRGWKPRLKHCPWKSQDCSSWNLKMRQLSPLKRHKEERKMPCVMLSACSTSMNAKLQSDQKGLSEKHNSQFYADSGLTCKTLYHHATVITSIVPKIFPRMQCFVDSHVTAIVNSALRACVCVWVECLLFLS